YGELCFVEGCALGGYIRWFWDWKRARMCSASCLEEKGRDTGTGVYGVGRDTTLYYCFGYHRSRVSEPAASSVAHASYLYLDFFLLSHSYEAQLQGRNGLRSWLLGGSALGDHHLMLYLMNTYFGSP